MFDLLRSSHYFFSDPRDTGLWELKALFALCRSSASNMFPASRCSKNYGLLIVYRLVCWALVAFYVFLKITYHIPILVPSAWPLFCSGWLWLFYLPSVCRPGRWLVARSPFLLVWWSRIYSGSFGRYIKFLLWALLSLNSFPQYFIGLLWLLVWHKP